MEDIKEALKSIFSSFHWETGEYFSPHVLVLDKVLSQFPKVFFYTQLV